MSLINQVLQDLEKRHASDAELKSMSAHVRAVHERMPSYSSAPSIAIIVLLAVIVGAAGWYFYSGSRTDGNQEVVRSTEAPAAAPAQDPPSNPISAASRITPSQTASFIPASRLSEELLSIGASPGAREKSKTGRRIEKMPVQDVAAEPSIAPQPSPAKTQTSSPVPAAVVADSSKVEPAPVRADPPKVDQPPADPVPVEVPEVKPVARAKSVAAAAPPSDASVAIDKQMRESTPAERAELAFRKGVAQIQEGRAHAAELDFREALVQNPSHQAARQALLGLLIDSGRNNEAEDLLRKALTNDPRQPRIAMVLARLEVERGEVAGAINTMVAALPYVQSDPPFYAFLAAMLQREGRHREAADYYRTALRVTPGNGVWMMGLAISLRATNQLADARDAFQRALDSKQLTPELQEFVTKQLRELAPVAKK
jgi:MSHA biogenesis protein MshN